MTTAKKTYTLTALASSVVLASTSLPVAAFADVIDATPAKPTNAPTDLLGNIKIITNTLLIAVGIAAVIMLIIGAIRYIVSGGDPAGVKGAKDTIIYSIVGIVVAILAFAIVNFVITQFK